MRSSGRNGFDIRSRIAVRCLLLNWGNEWAGYVASIYDRCQESGSNFSCDKAVKTFLQEKERSAIALLDEQKVPYTRQDLSYRSKWIAFCIVKLPMEYLNGNCAASLHIETLIKATKVNKLPDNLTKKEYCRLTLFIR